MSMWVLEHLFGIIGMCRSQRYDHTTHETAFTLQNVSRAGTHFLDLMLTQKAICGSKIGENAHFWGVFKLRGAVKNF